MAANRFAALAVVALVAIGLAFTRIAPARGQDATSAASPVAAGSSEAAAPSPAASATPEAAASPATTVGAQVIDTGPPAAPEAPTDQCGSEPQ